MTEPAPHPALDELVSVLHRLRAPGGCAWDREQTHQSLVQYLIEETYELVDAIESGDRDELVEELGDVLYQVIFHSDIAAERGDFTLEDVAAHMTAKMIGRHPHVFGDAVADTPAAVMESWDRLKTVEKPHRTSVLDGIPQGMPALALADKLLGRAHKIGLGAAGTGGLGVSRAASTGVVNLSGAASTGVVNVGGADSIDGVNVGGAARTGGVDPTTEDELGKLLLAMVASAKAKGLDSERALRAALRELQSEIRDREAT